MSETLHARSIALPREARIYVGAHANSVRISLRGADGALAGVELDRAQALTLIDELKECIRSMPKVPQSQPSAYDGERRRWRHA